MNLKVWELLTGEGDADGEGVANCKRDCGALRIVVKSVIPVISFSAFGGIAQLVERLVRKDKRPIILTSSDLL
jgi:hypothetical protein